MFSECLNEQGQQSSAPASPEVSLLRLLYVTNILQVQRLKMFVIDLNNPKPSRIISWVFVSDPVLTVDFIS